MAADDPASEWEGAKLLVGDRVAGKVVHVRPFGVFVQLDCGPIALLLAPYFSPHRNRTSPTADERITAPVAVIDPHRRQVALTELNPDPRIEGERPSHPGSISFRGGMSERWHWNRWLEQRFGLLELKWDPGRLPHANA